MVGNVLPLKERGFGSSDDWRDFNPRKDNKLRQIEWHLKKFMARGAWIYLLEPKAPHRLLDFAGLHGRERTRAIAHFFQIEELRPLPILP